MTKEKMWYEVFRRNKDEVVETIFFHEDLEKCVQVYRKQKLIDKSIKLDKWLDAPYLDGPMPIKSILN